jgi:hypothetical protein
MNRSIAIFSCLLAGTATAEAKDPAANTALQSSLRSAYPWTNADGRTGEIIEPGIILVVRKEGITTNPADAPFHAQNNYKDGMVKRSALNLFAQDQNTAGRLVTGDRVFVTKTEVKETSIVLNLLSVETIHGIRVKASVAFPFPKGVLANASFDQVAPVIDELLIDDSPQPPPQQQTQLPATIEIGAAIDQVLSAMGEPPIVADINRKLIFFYPEIKVTFLDGKVIDVK